MPIVAHTGMPCDPPVVDGVLFQPHPEDESLYLANMTEEQAADITRIPAFTRFGGEIPPSLLEPANGTQVEETQETSEETEETTETQETAPREWPTAPVPKWSNKDLVDKCHDLGLECEGLKRTDLIQLVTGALKVVKE